MSSAFVLKQDTPFVAEEVAYDVPKTWIEWIKENVDFLLDFAAESLPSEEIQASPKWFRNSLAIFFYIILTIIFIVFFAQGYNDTIDTEFLSPLNNPNSVADPFCENLATTNTGTYLATTSGYWEGNELFEYSSASYQLQVSSYSTDFADYSYGMEGVYAVIYNLTSAMNASDLSTNLLVWMSYIIPISGVSTYFTFTGNPSYVFNRQYITGSYSSVHGVCQNISSQASFNFAASSFELSYDHTQFESNEICKAAVVPFAFGYIPELNSNTFDLQIDVRSLITALSINVGLVDFAQMNQIASSVSTFSYKGQRYVSAQYYNEKYPGMDPVVCINATFAQPPENREQCIVVVGNGVYGIPFFNHIGKSFESPEPCDCSTLTPEQLSDPYFKCNLFNFVGGIMYWNTFNYTSVLEQFIKVKRDMFLLNQQTFNASFISSYYGRTSKFKSTLQSNQSLYDAFEFCNIPGYGYCSMATFTAFDSEETTSWTVSEYYYQLKNGACRNSLLTSRQDWNLLIQSPFSALQQSYQQCHASPSVAATTNLGVTVGNIVLLAPLLAIAIVMSLSFFRFLFNIRIKRTTHSKKEQEKALEEFAESLLNTRDNYFSLLDLCNRYEVSVVGSLQQRISALESKSSNKANLTYAIQDIESPETRAKLKKRFVGQFIDVSCSVITFALVKELEMAGVEEEEAHKARTIDHGPSKAQNGNTKEKSSIWQFSPSMMASQNPMIADSLSSSGIELNSRGESTMNTTDNALEIDHLLLIMNKRNSKYSHHTLVAPHDRMVLTANVQSYDQWFSSLSAINVKLTMLFERRLKAELGGGALTKVERIERQHMFLVNELEHFTTISWLTFKLILFQADDEEKLLFNLLLLVLEIHGCLMLRTSDRSSIKTKYQHKVGISFSDVVWTYADLIRLSEDAGLP